MAEAARAAGGTDKTKEADKTPGQRTKRRTGKQWTDQTNESTKMALEIVGDDDGHNGQAVQNHNGVEDLDADSNGGKPTETVMESAMEVAGATKWCRQWPKNNRTGRNSRTKAGVAKRPMATQTAGTTDRT